MKTVIIKSDESWKIIDQDENNLSFFQSIVGGYIDILKSSVILNTGTLHGDKMLIFESPFCVEVDTKDDFEYLEFQIQKEGSPIINFHNNKK